jgi:crotonobetainyl-CoA:carnitine CoA-transferase CaiB-like acyl-CoA transferase
MRSIAPGWDAALNAGKESVACDLKADPELGLALCSRADVVLDGFRPEVTERLGIGPSRLPDSVVYCSITGFGSAGRHAGRAGHDLNYLGWAGTLADTAPALPPVQIADLGAGALTAVAQTVAALYERERTGRGRRIDISMTHGSHRFAAHRLNGEPLERLLTGGLACYGVYSTADRRYITVTAVEPKFFRRLCELIDREELVERQYDPDAQQEIASALAETFSSRALAAWLELFDSEDVMVGPVSTLEEAAAEFGGPPPKGKAPALGEHTEAWRRTLGQ